MPTDLGELEVALGYRFQNSELLKQAVTHSSVANEAQPDAAALSRPAGNNERLEFLGDSILGWVVSEYLYLRFTTYTEGQLSLLKNHLVSASHLVHTAQRLNLGQFLRLGRGEDTAGGRLKQRLLVNALEAILAAIYLDSGVEEVRRLIVRHSMPEDEELSQMAGAGPPHDFRAELERLARERKLSRPVYVITGEMGPGHARTFTVEARVGRELIASGEGSSKKAASHNAAQQVCQMLRKMNAE